LSEETGRGKDGLPSKSKQMLKKCINDIAHIREKGIHTQGRENTKIAAPKPVRARPNALSQLGNSKWLQTSPVKNQCEEKTSNGLDAL